jgi:hypothetical protein
MTIMLERFYRFSIAHTSPNVTHFKRICIDSKCPKLITTTVPPMIRKDSVTLLTKPSPHDIPPPKPLSIMEFSKHEHGNFLLIVQKHIHT